MVHRAARLASLLLVFGACTGGGSGDPTTVPDTTGSAGHPSPNGPSTGDGSGSPRSSSSSSGSSSGSSTDADDSGAGSGGGSGMRCDTDTTRDFCYCDNVTMKTSATTCTKAYSCCIGGKDGTQEWCNCGDENESACSDYLKQFPSWTRRSTCP